MEKFGFVYIWRDKKYNKYYIGSHWGTENDSYICGSTNMRNNYYRRRNDFKRKIIQKIYTNREDLLKEEQRFIDMIKIEEFGVKYYNISSNVLKSVWWMNETTKKLVGEKISEAHNTLEERTGKKWGHWRIGSTFKHTDEAKKKISEAARNISDETRQKISITSTGRKHSDETKIKMSIWQKGKSRKPLSEEHKRKIAEKCLGRKYKVSIVTCPHCNKSGGINAMRRYHFNNCKHKEKYENYRT